MALDITTTLAGLNGVTGGIVDASVATDPVIIEAGVTVNGGLTSLLGGLLGTVLGVGVDATLAGASVTNLGTVQGSTGAGIELAAGGSVVNGIAGIVNGVTSGISVAGTVQGVLSSVSNAGAVTANGINGLGVTLDTGALVNGGTIASIGVGGIGASIGTGSVANAAGASIAGALDGLDTTGAAVLTNTGTILGTLGHGVTLAAGSLENRTGGVVSGALDGVSMAAAGTVTNLGTIAATGPSGVGVNLLGGGVVIDAGTISGDDASGHPGGIAVKLGGAGGSRLVLDPGAVLNGIAQAAGTGNVLELAAGAGTTVLNDIGTTITGFGSTVVDSNAVTDVLGAVTAPGTVTLGSGASLTIGGAVGPGVAIDLGGDDATLTLGDVGDFAGQITNLGAGDALDLPGLGPIAAVSYDPTQGGLVITATGGVASLLPVTLAPGLDPASLSITVGSDGGIHVGTGTGGTGTGGTGGTGTSGTGTGSTGTGGTGTGGTGSGGTGSGGTGTGTGGIGGNGTVPSGTGTAGSGTGGGTTVAGGPTSTVGNTTGAVGSIVTTTPNGGITVTTTSPLGAATTQNLPAGSTLAVGTGAAQGDVVSIDPVVDYDGRGAFTLTGHVASSSGVKSVTLSARVDDASPVTLGTANVASDGSYSFKDDVGAHLQGFITTTETDVNGGTTAVQSPYSLQAGFRGIGFAAQQDLYSPDGSIDEATTNFHEDGSNTVEVHAAGQTFQSGFFNTFLNGGTPDGTFVFDPGHGLDVVQGFRFNGTDHDTINLPSADFTNLAAVLSHTQNTAGGAVITDTTSGDTIRLAGVTKAELKANPSDVAFH